MNESDVKLYNITLALAGIFQAATLVRDLAKSGTADEQAFTASINSIYKIDSQSVADVYDGTAGVRLGLIELIRLLGNDKTATDAYIGRYLVSILHLERKMMRNAEMRNTLLRRVKYAASQANYFSAIHPTVIASLADIYLSTLGTLSFRIHVLGQAKYLQQPEIVNKVRALLLAGVRSAVLWRQAGGTRWHLFLYRGRLAKMAKKILG